jgi:hypothetical protein
MLARAPLLTLVGSGKASYNLHPSEPSALQSWIRRDRQEEDASQRFFRKRALRPCYDLTAPAVMPSIKRRCRNTKISTTGNTIVTAAASIWPQSVEYCPVRL